MNEHRHPMHMGPYQLQRRREQAEAEIAAARAVIERNTALIESIDTYLGRFACRAAMQQPQDQGE